MRDQTKTNTDEKPTAGQLMDGIGLLNAIFPKRCRPTLRWLRNQQKLRRVPFVKIGKLVYFDPTEVRAAWRDRFTVGQPSKGAR
jgi:hypothetical protein